MGLTTILDNINPYIIALSNNDKKLVVQGLPWATTIIFGVGTCLIGLGLRRFWCPYTKKNVYVHRPCKPPIARIDPNFTDKKTIGEQRAAHEVAKKYLQEKAAAINAEIAFVSPSPKKVTLESSEITVSNDLNPDIFSWYSTKGVQGDIQNDAKRERVVLYGVASQFNASESARRCTPVPGAAFDAYRYAKTQGSLAQLQFPYQQVEIINNAANLGFNGLCRVLSEETKTAVRHGYLIPMDRQNADSVIKRLKNKGHKMEFLCVGNFPKGRKNTKKVYEMLVGAPTFGQYSRESTASFAQKKEIAFLSALNSYRAQFKQAIQSAIEMLVGAPAFGRYSRESKVSFAQKKEIAFLSALNSYRAQFKQAIELAISSAGKEVIFKPTPQGMGAFGNDMESVAKGFYIAAKEYEIELEEKNVKVELQVFHSAKGARKMAGILGLDPKKS